VPVLYLRGDQGNSKLEQYIGGFADSGLRNISTKMIPDSGDYIAEEQPAYDWKSSMDFTMQLNRCSVKLITATLNKLSALSLKRLGLISGPPTTSNAITSIECWMDR
jgi:hypothetical protein